MNTQIHTAVIVGSPMRLQEYGPGIFEGLATKSALKKCLKKGEIWVNGVLGTSATYIKGGEEIVWRPSALKPLTKTFNLSLDVLFEDAYLAAIYKPAGLLVSGNSFKTAAKALSQNLQASTAPDSGAPMPAHRLDYPTTGLLLVGKTAKAIRQLNALFEKKEIHKTYIAICVGAMEKEGLLNTAVDGKPAAATYELLETVSSNRFGSLSLLRLHPKTGRRHQLRKQLAAIGHPILGDQTYGIPPLILQGKGLFLHAYSVTFKHPLSSENMYIEAPLPKRFLNIFPKTHALL